jgi:hypothetical protein
MPTQNAIYADQVRLSGNDFPLPKARCPKRRNFRALPSASATERTHSARERVFPAPRPPRISQVVHGSPLAANSGEF